MIHINAGTNLYGRVLNVPGVLYVATVFRHIAFIPFAPITSWIVLEQPGLRSFFRAHTQWQGLQLAIPVWRSVFAAWSRAALVLFALWHFVAEGYHWGTRFEPVAWPWVAAAAAALLLASVAGRLGRARFEQIVELLHMADAPDALVVRVERSFDRKILQRWKGRAAEEAARGLEEQPPAPGDFELALTFSQRHGPRIFGVVALPLGALLATFERWSALERGLYSPKYLALAFMAMAMSAPAVALNIGRNRDLKVPWKVATMAAAGIAGLVAGWTAPKWLF